MITPPKKINNAKLLYITIIDERHRFTGNCNHKVDGELIGSVFGIAIGQFDKIADYYLFGCDEEWRIITMTSHKTLEKCREQAEFEYEGISKTWKKV